MGRGERGQRSAQTPVPGSETGDRRAGRAIERFHFAFFEAALAQVKPSEFALKGGGNLRMFLGSKRRSRDLDLDYLGTDFARFGDKIEAALKGGPLSALIQLRGVGVVGLRRSKNTDTVKRWKLSLSAPGMEAAPTKIEFSNRGDTAEPVVERCDAGLALRVGARALVFAHYPPVHAIEQKVRPLAVRSETQPRDVWDLDHLFREFTEDFRQAELDPNVMRQAAARVGELSFEDYERLVVDYLEEGIAGLYDNKQAWESIQLSVVSRLEERIKERERKE